MQKSPHLRLPDSAVAVLISRNNEFIIAERETELRIGDVIVVMADTAALDVVRQYTSATNAG